MKVTFIKQAGGVLCPASDMEAEKLSRFKTGEMYVADIKYARNAKFHAKVFVFFAFCFQFWRDDREFMDEAAQFDVFRNHLTCMAGYYNTLVNLNGEVRIEAKSLSYGGMEQEEFEQLYTALINAASKHVFKNIDKATEDKLMGFFY